MNMPSVTPRLGVPGVDYGCGGPGRTMATADNEGSVEWAQQVSTEQVRELTETADQ